MAKKNGETAGADTEAPVKSNPNQLEERHVKLREERRAIEKELGEIDSQIRTAIDNGDLESLDRLSARKGELPRLFIAASTAEMTARQAIFGAEDQANLKTLRNAEDTRDKLQAALVVLRAKHKEETDAMTAELHQAIVDVGSTYAAIQASRNLSAASDAGFKRAMAKLTGV